MDRNNVAFYRRIQQDRIESRKLDRGQCKRVSEGDQNIRHQDSRILFQRKSECFTGGQQNLGLGQEDDRILDKDTRILDRKTPEYLRGCQNMRKEDSRIVDRTVGYWTGTD